MKNLPKVLLLCFGLFAVGIGSTVGGWIIHRQSVPGGDVPNFSLWLVDAVGRVGPLLVSSDSDLGQRLGLVGIMVAAIWLTAALAILAIEDGGKKECRRRKAVWAYP